MPVKKPKKAMRVKDLSPGHDADIMLGKVVSRSTTGEPKGKKLPKRRVDEIVLTKATGSKYDWQDAREIFMTSQPAITLKQLSLRTGIPYQQIRNRSAKERWQAIRAQEQIAKLKDARREFQQRMAKEAISFDETSIDVAKLGVGIIAGRLIEISKLLEAAGNSTAEVIAKLKSGEPLSKGDLYSMVNYRELASLAQAALMFQQVGRTALGTEIVDGSLLNDANTDLEQVVSIGGELTKDDPKRLASFLEALERANLTVLNIQTVGELDEEEDTDQVRVVEGELVAQPEMKQIEGRPDV